MDARLAREMIEVIRRERERRVTLLDDAHPDYAYDRWLFTDQPFINELTLVLLVAIRHQLERDLVDLAARIRTSPIESDIDWTEFEHRVREAKQDLRSKGGWSRLITRLHLGAYPEWNNSLRTLQLLANCYKHEVSERPDETLLEHLSLPPRPYAVLPESDWLREGLALSLDLQKDADYCTVAEEFLARVERFQEEVARGISLVKVKWSEASFDPDTFEG